MDPRAFPHFLCVLAASLSCACARADGIPLPVVPGYEHLKSAGKSDPAALGELLLGELNCLACHAAEGQKHIDAKGAPDLTRAGGRITPQYLRQFLSDPHALKPGTTMPDLLHATGAAAKASAVESLTHFLASQGGPVAPATVGGSDSLVEQGRALFDSVGCAACHAPDVAAIRAAARKPEKVTEKMPGNGGEPEVPSVPLGNLALKTTPDELAAFLLDPLKVRPASRMPNVGLTAGEARAVAVYLLRDQLSDPQSDAPAAKVRGLAYAYYEGKAPDAAPATLDKLKPASGGTADRPALDGLKFRANDFAVRFTGTIAIPKDGKYTFAAKSDDGSRVYVGDKLVVNHDGIHPSTEKTGSIDLKAGEHPFVVTYFQGGGGAELTVSWQGPGVPRQPIPGDVLSCAGGKKMAPLQSEAFAVDAAKADAGRRAFVELGCASCHAPAGVSPRKPAKALAALGAEAAGGCLAENVAEGLPRYDLSPDQRQAIRAALKNAASLATPLAPKERVKRTLAAMNCYACHHRDDVGGPGPDRAKLFGMTVEADIGDEGRLPPKLTGTGDKLTPRAIEQIVFDGKLHVRPYLATRMPRFSRDRLAPLPGAFEKSDFDAAAELADPAPPFDELAAKDGRRLVGTQGLGCVNCHGVLGVKSLGSPGVDLAGAHDRLRHPWFHRLLLDPNKLNPGTRMPQFWGDGNVAYKEIAGGTVAGQVHAIAAYLSLGNAMGLPAGLQPGGYELEPGDEPIVARTFFTGVGPRAVAVGFPERVHVVFDADAVRLAKAWRGKFFDAKKMWDGRGGQSAGPLGADPLDFPPGPGFAALTDSTSPWPSVKPGERNAGGKFKGYLLDPQQRPIFRYVLDGIDIQEQPMPVLKSSGSSVSRRFRLTASQPPAGGFYFLAAAGKTLEVKSPGAWLVDGAQTVRVTKEAGAPEPVVRASEGVKQLLVPVKFTKGAAAFSVDVDW